MKIIKKILTAIGNPVLNNELKKINELCVINNDIQYQEGIFEILEKNNEIDFIILSQIIPGSYGLEETIEKIQNINSKIKIIIILENYNSNLENILLKKGIYRIFYNNKIEIKDIIKIINEDDKMEKYNAEIRREIDELKEYIKNNSPQNIKNKNNKLNKIKKINKLNKINLFNKKIKNNYIMNNFEKIKNLKKIKKLEKNKILNYLFFNKINKNKLINNIAVNKNNKKNKIISILGTAGTGKSIVTTMLAVALKKYNKKILIIDFDILNNNLHTILGVKKYSEKIKNIIKNNNFNQEKINIKNLIISINKKIDLISGINLIFDSKDKIPTGKLKNIIMQLYDYYELIIIDTTSECFFEYTKEIIKISDECVFLSEANLLGVSKSRRLLQMYNCNWQIPKEKIKILFNKFNKGCIDYKILKNIYSDYNILGILKFDYKYDYLINKNINNFEEKNKIIKNYNKIGKNIIKIN